jgi:hypothetical protein
MKKLIVFLSIFCTLNFQLMAQETNLIADTMKDASVIAVAGVGGAILGLSTLSFVDEPQDHLSNIYIGAAIGVIIGVGYVAYSAATKGRNYYYENGAVPDFSTKDRLTWHNQNFWSSKKEQKPTFFDYRLTF